MNNSTPESQTPNEEQVEETLAERSARLEAEAAAMNEQPLESAHPINNEADPLAPEPLDESTPEENDTDAISDDQAKAIITALQNELDAAKDQTARALAEAENTRRRAQKDREDASKFAVSAFAKDLLEISDTLRRAIEAAPNDMSETEPRVKSFIDGVEATERILLKNFEKHGIQKIEPLDEPFNPNYHEVMFETPVPGKPAGLVMQVVEPGYVLNDRLLRAAKVGITKDDGSTGQEPPPAGGTIDTEA